MERRVGLPDHNIRKPLQDGHVLVVKLDELRLLVAAIVDEVLDDYGLFLSPGFFDIFCDGAGLRSQGGARSAAVDRAEYDAVAWGSAGSWLVGFLGGSRVTNRASPELKLLRRVCVGSGRGHCSLDWVAKTGRLGRRRVQGDREGEEEVMRESRRPKG